MMDDGAAVTKASSGRRDVDPYGEIYIVVPPTYERAALISLISNHKSDLILSGRFFSEFM
jgi:hypothetical protein